MANQNQLKLEKFLGAIEREEQRKLQQAEKQTNMLVEAELKKAKSAIIKQSNKFLHKSLETVRLNQQKRVSEREAENNRKYLAEREKLFNKVVLAVEKMLADFAKSAEYEQFLARSSKNISAAANGQDICWVIKNGDQVAQKFLKQNYPNMPIETDENIKIGGLCARQIDGAAMFDDTLDMRLAEQKNMIYQKDFVNL